jgi:hypothetical protein
MSVRNVHPPQLGSVGLPWVIKDVLGNTAGKISLADVTIAVVVCAVVTQAAAVRMIFAMRVMDGFLVVRDSRTSTPGRVCP